MGLLFPGFIGETPFMLTDAACKNAVCPPDKKRARFTDSEGLYLEVSPAGSKRWFLKLYREGKETRLALGGYPLVKLKDARQGRAAARLSKEAGQDPVQVRKIDKLKALTPDGDTFKVTALEWYAMKLEGWSSHYAKNEILKKTCFPTLQPGALVTSDPLNYWRRCDG